MAKLSSFQMRNLPAAYGRDESQFLGLIFPVQIGTSATALNVPATQERNILPFLGIPALQINTALYQSKGAGLFDVIVNAAAQGEDTTGELDFDSGTETVSGIDMNAGTTVNPEIEDIDAGSGGSAVADGSFDYALTVTGDISGAIWNIVLPIVIPEG